MGSVVSVPKTYLGALLDYMYWQTQRILAAAAKMPTERFTAPATISTRNLRGTLVHALDVELSWRLRLQRAPKQRWDAVLPEDDYPDVASLAEHWKRDETDMRDWFESLDDETLGQRIDLDGDDRYPLWYYVLHLIMHGMQQRSEAAVLLTHFGESPGDLDFLDYADTARAATDPVRGAIVGGASH
jgi:uncharacterized damage-inducible protein DinB